MARYCSQGRRWLKKKKFPHWKQCSNSLIYTWPQTTGGKVRNQYLPSEAEACKCKARFSKSEVRTGIHGSLTYMGKRDLNQGVAMVLPSGVREWFQPWAFNFPPIKSKQSSAPQAWSGTLTYLPGKKRTHLLCLIPLPTKKKQNKKPFEVILPSTSSPFLLFRTACSLSVPWNRPHQSMWTHKKKKKCSKCITPFKKFPYFQTVARKYE